MKVTFKYTCGHSLTWEREDVDLDIAGECPVDKDGVLRIPLKCLDCTESKQVEVKQ